MQSVEAEILLLPPPRDNTEQVSAAQIDSCRPRSPGDLRGHPFVGDRVAGADLPGIDTVQLMLKQVRKPVAILGGMIYLG